MGILIILVTLWVIWKAWGIMFDGKSVDKELNPKPYVVKKLKDWMTEKEQILANPESTEKQRQDAIYDIEHFSRILKGMGVEV